MRLSPIRDSVLAMVNRTIGVATNEVEGLTVRQVGRAVEVLMAQGLAFAAKHTSVDVRYFSSQSQADLYLLAREVEDLNKKSDAAARSYSPSSHPDAVASWSKSAEPYFPVDASGAPAWKFTTCPPSQIGLTRTNTHTESH